MLRLFGSFMIGLIPAVTAEAHFVFVLPQPGGTQAQAVFSDSLEPDDAVDIGKIGGTQLSVRDAAGKVTPLPLKKGENAYWVTVPDSGPRLIFGVTDYGVLQRGDSKPFRLVYHCKAVLGATPEQARLGGDSILEVVPVGAAGAVRFQVLSKGKPVPDSEVNLILPDGKKQKATTDKEGMTSAFDQKGRYGAWTRLVEAAAGEKDGKKFEETRHYATVVVDVGEIASK